jgi:hypothetical protein
MHQQPPPTFLQVRDALTLEELTRGHHTPASTTPPSSTSRALVAAPPPPSASPPASLLGASSPGPSGGRGAVGAIEAAVDAVVGVVGRPPRLRPSLSLLLLEVRPGRPLPPVVRAYLHVALPGSGRGASSPAPAGGHGHECCLLRADRASTSSAQLVVVGGVGSGCPGAVL